MFYLKKITPENTSEVSVIASEVWDIIKTLKPISRPIQSHLLDAMAKEPGRLIDKEKSESVEASLLKSTLLQITIPEGESKEGVLYRIYEDIKKSIKGNIIKIVIIIALSIAAGIGIGYYIGLTLPNS